jgi:SAM-dependent methyltransferase
MPDGTGERAFAEDSYGRVKRLDFVRALVRERAPRRILDIGCGTGMQLTAPLAAAHPEIEIIGVDSDAASIAWASARNRLANLRFAVGELAAGAEFDLVIASEVLEHVAAPGDFLQMLRRRLATDGRLIITVPNGYGIFEWCALGEVLLNLSGLQAVLRRLKRGPGAVAPDEALTLAVSPHVNFFSLRELRRLFDEFGLAVESARPRTLVCGYILDSLLRAPRLIAANARLADRLPLWCAADWMFALKIAGPPRAGTWRRGAWARWRKRLNERRWRIAR